jgi:hypothetical protein
MPQTGKPKAGTTRGDQGDRFDPRPASSWTPDEFSKQERRRDQILKYGETVRPGRTTPIAVRFDQFTLRRLRRSPPSTTPAIRRCSRFVVERLYEEEKRAGIIES